MKKLFLPLFCMLIISCHNEGEKPGFKADEEQQVINESIDQWHRDAAQADPAYFSRMAANSIYIGTDKTEHWTKEEFQDFARPYFEKGQAWDFEPLERHVFFSENRQVAWFDELLATWMGTCRASGVLICEGEEWKISHYHLSLAVPNPKMHEVIGLIGEKTAAEN